MDQAIETLKDINSQEPDNTEDIFGRYIACELKSLPEFMKTEAKKQIMDIIWKIKSCEVEVLSQEECL